MVMGVTVTGVTVMAAMDTAFREPGVTVTDPTTEVHTRATDMAPTAGSMAVTVKEGTTKAMTAILAKKRNPIRVDFGAR